MCDDCVVVLVAIHFELIYIQCMALCASAFHPKFIYFFPSSFNIVMNLTGLGLYTHIVYNKYYSWHMYNIAIANI